MMRAFSKTLLSLMVLAAFWYKANAPLFAQTSVQKLTPLPQPTMNLPRSIDDNCSFMLPSGEPIFLCVTNRPLSSSTADTSIPQYEIKTYVYHLASSSSGVSWAAKPIESSWSQRNRGEVLRQVTGDGKILIWQGAGNWEPDGPVLLDDQGNQTTVPGIFHLGKNNVYQPVDLTKIEDPKFISTQDGGYILAFSEIQNSQKLWKVWGLGVVSERLGGGQLTIIWEKTLPLNGNIDQVTFFQTSDDQTIVAYSETVKNKLKIQVINFGRLAQAAALRPIAVWQNTFEIPGVYAEKFLAEQSLVNSLKIPGVDAEKFLAKQSLINIQEYKTGQFLLSVGWIDSAKSNTYTKQCFWVFREGVNSKDGVSSPLCKNYYSNSLIDQQGNLWLAHLEKAPSSENPALVVEILDPFASPFWGNKSLNKNLKVKLPAGVFLSEWALRGKSIPWMDTIATQPDQMPKLMLVVGGVYEEKRVDVFLEIGANGNIEKPFILPRPTGDSFVRAKDVNTFQPIFFAGKISADKKYVWISGRYWWPFSTLLPGGNAPSQLFYVPLSK